jgi:hypothetical protein
MALQDESGRAGRAQLFERIYPDSAQAPVPGAFGFERDRALPVVWLRALKEWADSGASRELIAPFAGTAGRPDPVTYAADLRQRPAL